MIKWAGRIFVFLGIGHTVLTLALVAPDNAAAWFSADLWSLDEGVIPTDAAMSTYWLSIASFSVPLMVLGLAVLWADRRGLVPPAYLGWILLVWTALNTVILLPTPWILGVAASVLYLVGTRRAARLEPGPTARAAALLETSQ